MRTVPVSQPRRDLVADGQRFVAEEKQRVRDAMFKANQALGRGPRIANGERVSIRPDCVQTPSQIGVVFTIEEIRTAGDDDVQFVALKGPDRRVHRWFRASELKSAASSSQLDSEATRDAVYLRAKKIEAEKGILLRDAIPLAETELGRCEHSLSAQADCGAARDLMSVAHRLREKDSELTFAEAVQQASQERTDLSERYMHQFDRGPRSRD